MSSLKDLLTEKLATLSQVEFNYIETSDVNKISEIDLNCSGVYMEATVVYFEIKNMAYIMKEYGRRKMAQIYTMYHEVLTGIAAENGAFVNSLAPNAFLVVFPGNEDNFKVAIPSAFKIAYALSETFKPMFPNINGLEFSMGMDQGHILGTKTLSDNGLEGITWFGTCILKAKSICRECARPYYVGISSHIYHHLDDDLRITRKRILGIPKSVEIWTRSSYQYENVKKHLYQSNHKIPFE